MTMDQLSRNELIQVLNRFLNMQRELDRRRDIAWNYESQYSDLQVVPKRSFVEKIIIALVVLWFIQIPLSIPAFAMVICSSVEDSILIPIIIIGGFVLCAGIILLVILIIKKLNKRRKEKYLKNAQLAIDAVREKLLCAETDYEAYKAELEKTYNYYNLDRGYRDNESISRIYELIMSNYNLSFSAAARKYDEEVRHRELLEAQNKIRSEIEESRRENAQANRVREKQLNDIGRTVTEMRNRDETAYYNLNI